MPLIVTVLEMEQRTGCGPVYAGSSPVGHPKRRTSQGKAKETVNLLPTGLTGSIPVRRTHDYGIVVYIAE